MWECGDLPAFVALIEKTPFDSGIGVTPAGMCGLARDAGVVVGDLVADLNSIANSKIEVDLRNLIIRAGTGYVCHRRQVDFPVGVAGCSRIVAQEWRTGLRVQCRWQKQHHSREGKRASAFP